MQSALETALSQVAAAPVKLVTAGRTDTGVHAAGQVVSFFSPNPRPADAFRRGGNSLVAPGISIHWAQAVPADFNARFSALYRRYQYLVLDSGMAPAIGRGLVTWSRVPLDADAMDQAAQALLGEQDFSAVRAAGCESRTPMRQVQAVSVRRQGAFLVFEIQANAFLQHMVRNIMGALLRVGRGERPSAWMAELLAGRDRSQAGVTAPPDGLYLAEVGYPAAFGFPAPPPPLLLRATD